MLHLHKSNRVETLADALAEVLNRPVRGPLDAECLVVQGRGMGLWLSQQLSSRLGIWTNAQLLYPRHLVQRACEAALGGSEADAPFVEREQLVWHVLAVLPDQLGDPTFADIARYVADDARLLRRFGLARRVAEVFDRYLVYRPELIRAWEGGNDGELERVGQAWQPRLWRAVSARLRGRHIAALEGRLLEALTCAVPGSLSDLPPRISAFGLSSLPPLYVRVLAAIARHSDVHIYLLSPSPHFLSDLVEPRKAENAVARGGSVAALHLESARSLLASLGRMGADFTRIVDAELEALQVTALEHLRYEEPGRATLLERLQNDLFTLAPPARELREPVAASDRSIEIHSCHGPMREIEVLHDLLLDLFANDPALMPHDVVVMMPDVEAHAPLVEAVFERDRGTERFIPYRIADRAVRRESPVIEAFRRLLGLVGSRLTASEVLDLLTLEPIRRRFEIGIEDVERITEWVVAVNVRWGIDREHRDRELPPGVHENTWRFGLERLLLGHALPTDQHQLFAGRLPFDDVEGESAELVGKLADLGERLFATLAELEGMRPATAWQADLARALDVLLSADATSAWEHQRVREALHTIAGRAKLSGFSEPISLDAMRELLDEELDDRHTARGFLSGGVTFCAMVPMRAIPFPVVCLLGMSDRVFPRSSRAVDFDLTAGSGRRPGDRSRRDDDRYLFLEALLSARQRLLITFGGQSIRDNARLPPSVVVSELVDELVGTYGRATSDETDDEGRLAELRPGLFVRHPLQPFSRRYFEAKAPQLFSFSPLYLEGARHLGAERAEPTPFFAEPLSRPVAPGRLRLEELMRFFRSPVEYLVARRLQVNLRDDELEVPDREPWALTGLEEWNAGSVLLDLELAGQGERGYEATRAGGLLPPAQAGRVRYATLCEAVRPLARAVRAARGGAARPALPIDLTLANRRLTGRLDALYPNGQILHQFSQLHAKHVVGAWILHLALSTSEKSERTVLLGRPPPDARAPFAFATLLPVQQARERLGELCELYDEGQCRPLPLFVASALSYVKELSRDGDRKQALRVAQRAFTEEMARDRYLQRVYGTGAQLTDYPAFVELAERVFAPVVQVLREGGTESA